MDNIQQRESFGLFLRFTSICQIRCAVLNPKDDTLTKENNQCLEKCTNHIIDSFKKVQNTYRQ